MLARIIRTSLRHPRLIMAACVVFLVYGALVATSLKVDTLPVLAPARTSVETEAPGMVAEQVEQLVTHPIEIALLGARGVAAVHSQSIQGLSIVTLDFQPGADPGRVRQAISEGLATVGTLPAGIGAPRLAPLTSGEGAILKIGFTSRRLTPMALREVVDWTVRPRLLAVPGVARVAVFGGAARRIEVRARAGDLSDSDLGYADVFEAVRRATGVTGAGFVNTPNQRVLIEPRGQALSIEDVAAGQIQVVGSAPVRISDVADVVDAPTPAYNDALVDGRPGVVVDVSRQLGAFTLDTTRAVEMALAALTPALAQDGVEARTDLDRPASFITGSVREILWELAVGAVLAALLLAAFLRDPRAALIAVLSIPLSMLAAVCVLAWLGWSLDTMTLGGLAVALGLIVDDAVIDVESIVSQQRDAKARHASPARAVLMASLEVRAPVIYATLLIVMVLAPVSFLPGEAGALLRPMAVSLAVAILASVVVAILVTPALCLLLLGHVRPSEEAAWFHRIQAAYEAALARLGGVSRLMTGVAVMVMVAALVAFLFFRIHIPPTFHGDHLTVRIEAPPGTAMAVMDDYGERITRDLSARGDVRSVSVQIGRAEGGDEAWGPEHAQLDIGLRPGLSTSAQGVVETRVRDLIAAYPGLQATVRGDLGAAVLGSGQDGETRARVYGGDLDRVDATARKVAAVLATTPGARDVALEASSATPVVRVDLNFQRLAIYGLSAADVLDTVQTAFQGRRAAQIYENGREVDIALTAQAELGRDPEGAGDLLLRSSSGVSAPLKRVANVYLTEGRGRIEHDGGLRRRDVLVDPTGDVRAFVRLAQARINKAVALPPRIYVQVMAPSRGAGIGKGLLLGEALAGCGVMGLLLAVLGGVRVTLIVLGTTAFAVIGGVVAVALTGGVLSLGAVMGFVALLGLSTRNAILLIARADDLVARGGRRWEAVTVWRAAGDRLWAILISALLIAAALLPLAVRAGQPGHEVLGPMVFVILGGLATSTPLSLFVSPSLVIHGRRPAGAAPPASPGPAALDAP